MKHFLQRFILHRRLARLTAHLDAIRREREMLDASEKHCVREAHSILVALLNLNIRARRHV